MNIIHFLSHDRALVEHDLAHMHILLCSEKILDWQKFYPGRAPVFALNKCIAEKTNVA